VARDDREERVGKIVTGNASGRRQSLRVYVTIGPFNMPTLEQLIPNVDVLLALSPEELAFGVLQVAKSQLQNGMFNAETLALVTVGRGMVAYQTSPYQGHEQEVALAITEAINW
jgi:hypothetical protein